MSDNIPFDIQMEIIKRVSDVKSLIRFRSVSKPWKSFIDSPEFIACFGVRHTQPHRLLLRYRDNNVVPNEVKYVSFVDDENDILTQQPEFAPNVPLLVKQLYNSKVIGSSYGLWCLHGYKHWTTEMLVIWNPSIRKSVGIASSLERNKWQVGIFTLSSKTWKMIPSSNVLRESIRRRSSTPVAIDRFIYWFSHDRIVANDGVSEIKKLMSFDLIAHEFKEINLPPSLTNRLSVNFSISKLSESLVVSAYTYEVNHGRVYGVWMMGEQGGVMTSFTKLFNIKAPYDSSVSKVLGFAMSGEPIMVTETDDVEVATVKVYKPCSEHINDLGINGEYGSFFIFPYIETLLLVDHSDCCIISNDS
ncbi:putative F-box domain-containing protein [Tanacetum coccineum]